MDFRPLPSSSICRDTSARADPRANEPLGQLGTTLAAEQYMIRTVRTARAARGLRCPRCGSARVAKWGTFLAPERTRQRYRCNGCRRTFSDFTATPAAYSKRLSRWPLYLLLMRHTATLRASAAATRIHPSTALRWRHRILDALSTDGVARLGGWVELMIWHFGEAQPGREVDHRIPRRRGQFGTTTIAAWSEPVLFAVSRDGGFNAFRLRPLFGAGDVSALLRSHFSAGATLLHVDRPVEWLPRAARAEGCHYVQVLGTPRSQHHPIIHRNRAFSYFRAFRSWLHRFRGIATRNLARYVAWHRTTHDVSAADWLERWLQSWCRLAPAPP